MLEKFSEPTAKIANVVILAFLFCVLGQISASAQTACARLDVEKLNVPPINIVEDGGVEYIESYLDQGCYASAEGHYLDLSVLQSILSSMPASAKIFVSPKAEKISTLRSRVARTLISLPVPRSEPSRYTAYDAAVDIMANCQVLAQMTFNRCRVELKQYEATYETLKPESGFALVDGIQRLGLALAKDELGMEGR